jgi:signal transduction histidine kinase/CheY-like chemotaxis protein/transcriptional regulator with GAF, ATPase, and Fis domain
VINIQSSEEEGLFSAADVRPLSTIAANIGVAIQNARLFEETQHRAQQLATAAEVSRASISVLNPDELIVRAVELIRERFDLYYAAIFLVDEAGEWAVLQHATGEAGRKLLERGHRLAVGGQSMVGWAVANHQARIALDVGLERVRFVNPLLPETRSEMALPLAVGNTVLGALDVQSTQPNAFSESDITVLQNMADQVATAIQNARLFKAIAQERESLALLYDLLRALSVSLEMTTTVNTTLRFAPRLGAQHAYILLLGNTEEETIFRSTVPGLDQLSVTQAREFALTLERWVLENRRPAVVADTREDERWYTAPSHVDPQGEPARSVISVPLQSQRGTLAGVLAYTHSEPGALTEAQLPLIESIAGLVSVALENARLYDQIRTQRFHASALARAAQTMSRTLSETDLLQALAAELFETYRPNGVIVYRWDAVLDTLTPVVTRINPEELQRERWPVVGQSVAASERPDLLAPILNREGAILPIRQESEYQVRESMSMPLIYSGQVEVVVEVIYTGPQHGLSQDDLSLFKDILNAASSAMQTIRLYELQRHTAERLAEVDRLKSQFLANMSHELRTPLNSIIGFSRVILKGIDGPITELQTQDLTSIYNAGQHLLGLINDILDMSRIEAGKMELVFDEVDLRDILKGVLSTTTALIKDKPIVLQDDIAPNLPTVRADSMRVRQVLLNLLANAAKFTESGSITLRARTVPVSAPHDGTIGRFVEISVMDTGQGIPQKDMSKLFEAFSQVDASPTRKVGGTGLGLSICRNLVELHGGRIWGESEGLPGRGATFSFTLPIYQPELTTPLEPVQVPEGAPVILVVDDDQGLLSLYRRYLEPHGYKIVGVSRSAEVLPRALEHKPVAILLDVIMPNQNGWQVLADLKQNPVTRDIPVIMCTIATDQARALSLGAADYLVKPILESDLLQAFNRLQISGLMPKNGNGERHELQVIK